MKHVTVLAILVCSCHTAAQTPKQSFSHRETPEAELAPAISLSDALDQISAPLDADSRVSSARREVEVDGEATRSSCADSESAACLSAMATLKAAQAMHAETQATAANDRMRMAHLQSQNIEELIKKGPDLSSAWQPLRNLVEDCGKQRICAPIKKQVYFYLNKPTPQQALQAAREVDDFLIMAVDHYRKVNIDQQGQSVVLHRDAGELVYAAMLRRAVEGKGIPNSLDDGTHYYDLRKKK